MDVDRFTGTTAEELHDELCETSRLLDGYRLDKMTPEQECRSRKLCEDFASVEEMIFEAASIRADHDRNFGVVDPTDPQSDTLVVVLTDPVCRNVRRYIRWYERRLERFAETLSQS